MPELSAGVKGGLVMTWLLTEGPLTVAMVAERLYETRPGAWKLLNLLGGSLPIVNDRGWWYLDIKTLSDARWIHELTRIELDCVPPGVLYTRLFKRADVERIHRLTGEILRIGFPEGKSNSDMFVADGGVEGDTDDG